LFLVAGVGLAACSTDSVDPPSTPTSLAVVIQPSAEAESGVPFARQPVVELRDAQGRAVATRGLQVTAALATGTGTLGGTLGVRTDASGQAHFTDLAVTGTTGARALRFTASGLGAATSATFDLGPGAPVALTPAAGNNQTAPAGTALPVAPGALVADGAGNPVPNVSVTFSVSAGGGSVDGATALSGADGIAAVTRWTLGPKVGANTLTARVGSLEQVFTATGTVGPAAKVVLLGGDGQTGPIGAAVTVAPSVKVTDAFDNPVAGVALTVVIGGGGTIVPANPQTDANGLAQLTSWTLGFTPGAQTLSLGRAPAPPVVASATATDFAVQAVASGNGWSCGLAPNGTAACWGRNASGQLGDNTVIDKSLPTAVAGGRVFSAVAVGGGHSCALTPAGDAWCWGSDTNGQLGDFNFGPNPQPNPVAVLGGHHFTMIAAGDLHTCALDTAGAAWCWGEGSNGRLGDGTNTDALLPVAVAGGHTFSAISAGSAHTCGLATDGRIFCWGSNNGGRLGDGTGTDQLAPSPVASGATTFTAMSAGGGHTCAVATTGTAFCWGLGAGGTLGNGATANQPTPVAVSGTLTFDSIAVGSAHSCGIVTGGQVRCWGNNGSGRLGDGTVTNRNLPTAVVGSFLASAIELGVDHTCVRTTLGSAVCWGGNSVGQLGDGTTVGSSRPIGVHRP
jgi:alpha-tubulin suppressor-like RCC1 family protein